MDKIELQEDLANLKNLDKQQAILTMMHLMDAADLLTTSEPRLALMLTTLADAILRETNLQDEDIEENRKIIDDIRHIKETMLRVEEK